MRLAPLLALSLAAAALVATTPADAQQRRNAARGDQTERITIIDENGRARTRITVRPRSFLDGGTEVVPGERKFMDYAQAPTYSWLARPARGIRTASIAFRCRCRSSCRATTRTRRTDLTGRERLKPPAAPPLQ